MQLIRQPESKIPPDLIEAIRSFPLEREVHHCGESFAVSPFDIYAVCPRCEKRLKVRSFSATSEIEDLFDAVFEWMNRPGAQVVVRKRQEMIADEGDE